MISQVYDTLGVIQPFILLARRMLQEACASQVSWDDPIPEPLVVSWKSWLKILPCLN